MPLYLPLPQHTRRVFEALYQTIRQPARVANTPGLEDPPRTVSSANDIEMGGHPIAVEAALLLTEGLLAPELFSTKFARTFGSAEAYQEYMTVCVTTARLFRAVNFFTYAWYPLSKVDDDAVFYNPFFYTTFSLALLEMSLGMAEVARNRWQGTKFNLTTAEITTEFFECTTAIIGLYAYYIENIQDEALSLKTRTILNVVGISVGFSQLISDVKGQGLVSSSHSHPAAHGKPVSDAEYQQTPAYQLLVNGVLRLLHFAHTIVLYYSIIDVLSALPIPDNFFANHLKRAPVFALPFALAYALSNLVLITKCLWAEQLPSYTRQVNYFDMMLHAITNMCLAFNATFFFSVNAQLYINDQPNDGYILTKPNLLFGAVIVPSLLAMAAVLPSSIKQHNLMFGRELENRLANQVDFAKIRDIAEHHKSSSIAIFVKENSAAAPPNGLGQKALAGIKQVIQRVTTPLDERSMVRGLNGLHDKKVV